MAGRGAGCGPGAGSGGCGRGKHGAAFLGARSSEAGGAQGSRHRARLLSGTVHALPRAPHGLCAASPEPRPRGLLAFGLCHRFGLGHPGALGWVSGVGGPHRIFSVQFWLGSETSGCLCFTCLGIRSAYSSCLRSAVGCPLHSQGGTVWGEPGAGTPLALLRSCVCLSQS